MKALGEKSLSWPEAMEEGLGSWEEQAGGRVGRSTGRRQRPGGTLFTALWSLQLVVLSAIGSPSRISSRNVI